MRTMTVIAAGLFLAGGAGYGAAAEPARETKNLVTVTRRDAVYDIKTGKARVTVAGHAPRLPSGARITLSLEYHFAEVTRVDAVVGEDGAFKPVVLEPEMPLPPGDEYELSVRILQESQMKELAERVQKVFDETPHEVGHGKITLGTAAQHKAALERARSLALEVIKSSIALNAEFLAEADAAEKGKKHRTGDGAFDAAAWRRWLDKTWRPKVAAVQKKLSEWREANPAFALRFTSMEHLHDMTRLVAFRSMLRSRVLYQRNRMTVALEDTAFEGLEFTPKRRTRLRTEKSVHEALGEFYRIVTENFGVEIETAGKGDARKPDATKPAGEAAKGGEDVRAPSPKPAAPAKGDAR